MLPDYTMQPEKSILQKKLKIGIIRLTIIAYIPTSDLQTSRPERPAIHADNCFQRQCLPRMLANAQQQRSNVLITPRLLG